MKPLTERVLYALPATLPELCSIFEKPSPLINSTLCNLRLRGLIRRTDRRGQRYNERGALPHIWERT